MFPDTTNFMHSTFWLAHPEYWRVPGSTSGWTDRAFDYAIPAVREHHMAFVRELLARYDADGLELDWMRFGYHFKPGHEEEGRAHSDCLHARRARIGQRLGRQAWASHQGQRPRAGPSRRRHRAWHGRIDLGSRGA